MWVVYHFERRFNDLPRKIINKFLQIKKEASRRLHSGIQGKVFDGLQYSRKDRIRAKVTEVMKPIKLNRCKKLKIIFNKVTLRKHKLVYDQRNITSFIPKILTRMSFYFDQLFLFSFLIAQYRSILLFNIKILPMENTTKFNHAVYTN